MQSACDEVSNSYRWCYTNHCGNNKVSSIIWITNLGHPNSKEKIFILSKKKKKFTYYMQVCSLAWQFLCPTFKERFIYNLILPD